MQAILDFFQNEWVIQAIGFLGMAATLIGMQCKKYGRFLAFRVFAEFLFGSQFLLMGHMTGTATNYAAIGTNTVYYLRNRKNKSVLPFQILFGGLFVAIGFFTWDGPLTLLAIGAKLISTVAMGIKSTKVIRILNLFSTPLWIVYDIAAGTIGGTISDVLVLVSVVVGIVRLDLMKKEEKVG